MRINHICGPWMLGIRGGFAPINECFEDPRSLTGSEMAVVRSAQEHVKMGHDVHLYTVSCEDTLDPGVRVHPMSALQSGVEGDLTLAWLYPQYLQHVRGGRRVMIQTVNDLDYFDSKCDELIDTLVCMSQPHQDMLLGITPWLRREKCVNIGLGCDPEDFTPGKQIPGWITYASAPGRGLHHWLNIWTDVQKAVPHARLHVFYHVQKWLDMMRNNTSQAPADVKQRANARSVEASLAKGLESLVVHETYSRRRMTRVWNQTEVMGYPCDPVNHFTEGFSCSTLEACASWSAPVVMQADALHHIYGSILDMPERGDLEGFKERVIHMLTSASAREELNNRAREFSLGWTWRRCAEELAGLV